MKACTSEEKWTEPGLNARQYSATIVLQNFWGVPDETARRNALDYYHNGYQNHAQIGGLQSAYYSVECALGKAMDEHLPDSTWMAPYELAGASKISDAAYALLCTNVRL